MPLNKYNDRKCGLYGKVIYFFIFNQFDTFLQTQVTVLKRVNSHLNTL